MPPVKHVVQPRSTWSAVRPVPCALVSPRPGSASCSTTRLPPSPAAAPGVPARLGRLVPAPGIRLPSARPPSGRSVFGSRQGSPTPGARLWASRPRPQGLAPQSPSFCPVLDCRRGAPVRPPRLGGVASECTRGGGSRPFAGGEFGLGAHPTHWFTHWFGHWFSNKQPMHTSRRNSRFPEWPYTTRQSLSQCRDPEQPPEQSSLFSNKCSKMYCGSTTKPTFRAGINMKGT